MVLVTGATGFVGSHIVKELVRQGHSVRGLVHSDRKGERLKGLPIQTVKGDITDFNSLNQAFREVKYLFSCVGIIVETREANFDSIYILGTKNLVEMALKNKVEHFVHISALGTRPNAISRYHQAKYKAEQMIINSGLNYTIFRPSIIFGPEDDFVNRFARLLKISPILPQIGSGAEKMQPVYVEDLAYCAVASLKIAEARNRIFEIGGPQQMTFEQILDVIEKFKGYGKRFHPKIPYTPVFNTIKLAEKVFHKLPVTSDQLLMLKEENTCDNSEVERVFKKTFTPLEQGLKQYWKS